MRVLFDTNVVLYLLLDREPFVEHALYLFAKVECSEITGLICAVTVTTIHYLMTKALGSKEAARHIGTLLSLFEIAPVNRSVLEEALAAGFSDFEDVVLYTSALKAGADCIVTRDPAGFKRAKIPVYAPEELASILESLEENRD